MILGLYTLKIYFRLYDMIFFDLKISFFFAYFEGVLFYFLMIINTMAFFKKDDHDLNNFISTSVIAILFGFLYVYFWDSWNLRYLDNLADLKLSKIKINKFMEIMAILVNNVQNKYYYNKFLIYLIKHNIKCTNTRCNCKEILQH